MMRPRSPGLAWTSKVTLSPRSFASTNTPSGSSTRFRAINSTDARARASKAREEEQRFLLEDARQGVIADVRGAYTALSVAKAVLPSLDRAVDAARANQEQAAARFKSGLGTSVELAEAEALRAEAEIRKALGEFDVARARA